MMLRRFVCGVLLALCITTASNGQETLHQINRSVNNSHVYGQPLTDPFIKALDLDGTYDCENYAIDKVKELHKQGLPGRVVAGKDARGQAHAVAVSGDYVLDSHYDGVYTLKEMKKLRMFKPND